MICEEENLFVQKEEKTQLTKEMIARIKN